MPILTHYETRTEIVTTVCDKVTGATLLRFTVSGESDGDSAEGLPAAAGNGLTFALKRWGELTAAYRRTDTDAALSRHGEGN